MALFDELKEIVTDRLGIDESEIKPESKFIDDLGADSLDLVDLVITLEDEFNIEISDEDVKKIVTIGDLVKAIEERIKNKG